MNIKKLIREGIEEALNELYPAGTEHDPSAPWLQKEPQYTAPEASENKEFKTIGLYPNEVAILQDGQGNKYAFYFNNLDKSDFAPYAQREITHAEKGWDDEVDYEYSEDWNIDSHVIENYVNNNISHMTRGAGMQAWESGIDIVAIDDALKTDLLKTYGENSSIQNALA